MGLRLLRERCRARLRELDVPEPFDVGAFCDAQAARRHRPLLIHALPELPGSGGPCGAWIATGAADHVFVEQGTSPLHREHIILHELAHMLCGHAAALPFAIDTQRLLPSLNPTVVQRVLARTSYTTSQEQEAEVLASMILEQGRGATRVPALVTSPEVAEVLDRFRRTLG